MFPLGHGVVGPRMVRLVQPQLRMGWLAFGGLLPDLIDKPLYYGLSAATGLRSAELGLISGTRTFGHTALFLIVLALIAWLLRRRPVGAILAAIAWGVASHLLLDNLGDIPGRLMHVPVDGPTTLDGLLFPLRGARFPYLPFTSVREHLLSVKNAYVLGGELLGAALLAQMWWARRRRATGAHAP